MPNSPESQLVCEMGMLPHYIYEFDILDKTFAFHDLVTQGMAASELHSMVKDHGFTLAEGKSKHHFEQDGTRPMGDPYFADLVMNQGYTEHDLLYENQIIGSLFLKRVEMDTDFN